MKVLEVRVSQDQCEIVYHKGKPHVIDNLSFVRDERHNCQLIVYATMSPIDAPLHLTPSFIDDIERQKNPDEHICKHCGCLTFEDQEIVVGGEIYCDDLCLIADEH